MSTPPRPKSVIPLKTLAAQVRINGRQKSDAEYSHNYEKSNPQGYHGALLQQSAVQKEQLKIEHGPKDKKRHPRGNRERGNVAAIKASEVLHNVRIPAMTIIAATERTG